MHVKSTLVTSVTGCTTIRVPFSYKGRVPETSEHDLKRKFQTARLAQRCVCIQKSGYIFQPQSDHHRAVENKVRPGTGHEGAKTE